MQTTATNRKVRQLLTGLRSGALVPRPEFQRRLVWTNTDKSAFLETVLLGYPFPEVYIAAGDVDVETGEGQEMLVDGQQRVTTLYQYFVGSSDLKLAANVPAYHDLSPEKKEAFLQYDVVVRDLGKLQIAEIREVFRRINATRYALNAMEIHNARYEGEYKKFGERVAQKPFFEQNKVFSVAEIRRMQDTLFALIFITTALSTYFNRDDAVEEYLARYNDEFDLEADVEKEVDCVLDFVTECHFDPKSRVWKKADLLTLLVEVHRAFYKDKLKLARDEVSTALKKFYSAVDRFEPSASSNPKVAAYYKATLQASNDRSNRILRGEIVREILWTPFPYK